MIHRLLLFIDEVDPLLFFCSHKMFWEVANMHVELRNHLDLVVSNQEIRRFEVIFNFKEFTEGLNNKLFFESVLKFCIELRNVNFQSEANILIRLSLYFTIIDILKVV